VTDWVPAAMPHTTARSSSRLGADAPSGHRVVAALDVGGTSTKGAIVDADMRVVHELRWTTPRRAGPVAVVDSIREHVAELVELIDASDHECVATGVVVPGVVDEARGLAIHSVNLGWWDLPLAAMLDDRSGRPVALGHDVRAGALAEHRLGAGRGATGMLFMPLGYGVAGAIIADGRLLLSGGYAGEIGHLVVEPDGDACGCGRHGCLESVASAVSIGRRYAARAGREQATAAEVADLVRAGDPIARIVWAEAVGALAFAIGVAATLVAPEVVVIGGGLSLAGELLLEPLRAAVPAWLSFQPLPRIVGAALGDRAGCLGAAMLAFQAADRPSRAHRR